MLADLCVLVILVLCIWLGYRAGFIRSCINMVSFVASIILSFLVYPFVSSILVKTPLYDMFVNLVKDKYVSAESLLEGDGAMAVVAEYLGEGIRNSADGVAGAVALLMINVISFVLVIILVKLAISIVANVLDIVAKLPILKQFNRLGGSIMGGLTGIVVLYIIFAAALVVAPMDESGAVAEQIESSTVASQMYKNNLLLNMVDKGE